MATLFNNIYIQFSIILLSIILVLTVLIIYIVQQTLTIRKEYRKKFQNNSNGKISQKQQNHQEKNNDRLWIKRQKSHTSINYVTLDSLPADLRQVDNNGENIIDHQQQQQQDPNGTQMVTFLPPKNNKNHNHSGGGDSDNHQQQHHTLPKRFPTPPPSVSMSAVVDIHDYRHDNDINELSEYCEPNH
ncbi:uncharacterized protein LOC113792570 [Dermatophagoides pteronyssinus]|uniref:uncharacterized protein LOC113792570 n=1 Tax=Dermatophagoides pteronyssinus TaxID=6956 RepID=UPI003F66B77A